MNIKKILKALLIIIGSISIVAVGIILFIGIMFISDLREDAQDTTYLDDVITTLDVEYHGGVYYKLIYHVSGFHDKVHFVSVYRDAHSSDNNRIIRDRLLHTVSLDIWPENKPNDKWVKGILVKNDSIYVTYDESLENTNAITNIDVNWDFSSN